ncbi:hypothetical protein AV521_10800 [Streptomyces sp. IMTB 2501]|uniref:hypothetical protein n=1 Tax=Streptomyces sp. IMTB 2501 TaxID=1776340 RepID=UPI00096CCD5E|nr:hypothetical protein [Streptomyces sp. IMTB 2501]OLZ71430.1 hypothetical protein AV521_10800 [Streptomyces sp. IMTB 2501]
MRTRTVLAAIALAGTVLLGGAAQALADDNDGMGDLMGNSGSAMPNSGGDFGSNSHAKPAFGTDASGFGQMGSIFKGTTGH